VRTWLAFALAAAACAQNFTQRGFLETGAFFYPQTAPGDSGRVVGDALLRYDASYKATGDLRFFAAFDARTDTHHEADRAPHLSWWDREIPRPALEIRRLQMTYTRGGFTLELGKQLIRWGKADLVNPTDRFAPGDYLNVVQPDYLPVTAVHASYNKDADTFELVFTPRFTPSRSPLLNQRWAAVPAGVRVIDAGAALPGGTQTGVRWNQAGSRAEYSASFFDGYNPLPVIDASLRALARVTVDLLRVYPHIRMYGGEAAVPIRWLTIKSEAAYFTSANQLADDYLLYVIQLERQSGEWSFVGGYAGEKVTTQRSLLTFAPDRGLTRAFLGRAGYTIDANRSVAFESAVRQNGDGSWLKLEYSQAFGQHWRATAGVTWIRGAPEDFLGQYRRSSHGYLILRYSF
jgi:hypothetical protein